MLITVDVRAIPLFARKYGTTCFTCHTTPPLLNDFGRRFQASGFQLPGASADPTAQVDQGPFPLALVAHPKIVTTSTKNNLSDSSAVRKTIFSGIELALFSTGQLGPHFSYFAETPVAIAGSDVGIDVLTAEVIWSDILGDGLGNLNLRFGKMSPLVAYPANVILSNADPFVTSYAPFSMVDSEVNTFILTDPMFGLSAFGLLPQVFEGLRWEVGLYGGNLSEIDLGKNRAVFVGLDQTIYLDNTPLRFGLSYFGGTQTIADALTPTVHWDNATNRVAVNIELTDPWLKRFQLCGEFVRGFDAKADSSGHTANSTIALIGTNIIILPERFYAFARLDYAEAKELGILNRQFDLGIRYHVLPNVVLSAGATQLDERRIGLLDRSTTSAVLGVLFGF
ncbi:MAG: hypothetical protein JSS75_14530 [Bacteroidetes bacterium]|nr:hypothetical protein [Bacteroidota bacterium]